MNPDKGAIGRDYINTSTLTGITRIEWENGAISTSMAVEFSGGILNMPVGFADGVDNTSEGGGLSEAAFNVHATTGDAKWEAHKSTADPLDLARSNVVIASSVWVARIPTAEVAIGTLTITPTQAASKILITGSVTLVKDLGTTARSVRTWIRRGNTNSSPRVGSEKQAFSMAVAQSTFSPMAFVVMDSPGTTSAVIYSIRAQTVAGISSYTCFDMVAQELPPQP